MEIEKSCGAVLYKIENNERKYVLVFESNNRYIFPNAHIENGESMIETAKREILEETGIEATFIQNLKRCIRYNVRKNFVKEVTYLVAKYSNQELLPLDKDIISVKAYPLEVALNLLQNKELKNILIEIDFILESKGE